MFFLVDKKHKVIFGWSAKCGCTHIKSIFIFLQNNNSYKRNIHCDDRNSLPHDIENYTTILISRNPYKRIVSGFLDKYKKNGELRHHWNYDIITFSMFVDELVKNRWNIVDYHHFTPQTSEDYDIIIMKSKCIKCYDIEDIDYKYIEELYSIKIPEILIHKRGGHERRKYDLDFNNYVYDLDMSKYYNYNVDIKYFYNEELKNKIFNFYKNDFFFFRDNGIDYMK